MKKLFILPIVALAMAACSDEKGPWGVEQENPQLPGFEASNLVVTPTSLMDEPVNLVDWNNENQPVPVAIVESAKDWPAGYDMKFTMQMSADDTFARFTEIETEVSGAPSRADQGLPAVMTVCVRPDKWQAGYSSTISKGPKAKTVYIRFAASAVNGTEEVRIGTPDFYVAPKSVTIVPIPSEFVIEDSYYLLGSINGWDVATAIKFEHSDADVYDDPVFTLFCNVNGADGWWWKIIPASTFNTGGWVDGDNASFGVADNGDDALSGMLVGRTATTDCGAGCLKVSGPMKMTINMEELTYSFESALEQLYTPGDANGWNQLASQVLTTTNYADYYGFAVLSPNGFKFSTQSNWNGTNYGATDVPGTLTDDGGAGNLTVETKGLYWCHVNIPELTYTTDAITTLGAIGDFNGWDKSVALQPTEDFLVWEATVDFGDGSGSFKIRANDAWTLSFGGDPNDLGWDNAPNIPAPGAGKYTVTLYLDAVPYVVEFAAE